MDQSYNIKPAVSDAADLNLNLSLDSLRKRLFGLCERADMIVATGGTPPPRMIARMERLIIREALLAVGKTGR